MSNTPTIDRFQPRGLQLWAALKARVRQPVVFVPAPELAPWYCTVINAPGTLGFSLEVVGMIKDTGPPIGDYVLVEVHNLPNQKGPPPYYNYIHKDVLAILRAFNFADLDIHHGTRRRMRWSDITATCCNRIMAVTGGDLSIIKYIWRVCISNPETRDIMSDIDSMNEIVNKDGSITVHAGDVGFVALLATGNKKGVAFMLMDHYKRFGQKIIEKAYIYTRDQKGWNICWVLGDTTNQVEDDAGLNRGGESPMSKKAQRKAKRLSRSSTGA